MEILSPRTQSLTIEARHTISLEVAKQRRLKVASSLFMPRTPVRQIIPITSEYEKQTGITNPNKKRTMKTRRQELSSGKDIQVEAKEINGVTKNNKRQIPSTPKESQKEKENPSKQILFLSKESAIEKNNLPLATTITTRSRKLKQNFAEENIPISSESEKEEEDMSTSNKKIVSTTKKGNDRQNRWEKDIKCDLPGCSKSVTSKGKKCSTYKRIIIQSSESEQSDEDISSSSKQILSLPPKKKKRLKDNSTSSESEKGDKDVSRIIKDIFLTSKKDKESKKCNTKHNKGKSASNESESDQSDEDISQSFKEILSSFQKKIEREKEEENIISFFNNILEKQSQKYRTRNNTDKEKTSEKSNLSENLKLSQEISRRSKKLETEIKVASTTTEVDKEKQIVLGPPEERTDDITSRERTAEEETSEESNSKEQSYENRASGQIEIPSTTIENETEKRSPLKKILSRVRSSEVEMPNLFGETSYLKEILSRGRTEAVEEMVDPNTGTSGTVYPESAPTRNGLTNVESHIMNNDPHFSNQLETQEVYNSVSSTDTTPKYRYCVPCLGQSSQEMPKTIPHSTFHSNLYEHGQLPNPLPLSKPCPNHQIYASGQTGLHRNRDTSDKVEYNTRNYNDQAAESHPNVYRHNDTRYQPYDLSRRTPLREYRKSKELAHYHNEAQLFQRSIHPAPQIPSYPDREVDSNWISTMNTPNQELGINNQADQQIQRYQRNMQTLSPTIPRVDHESEMNNQAVQQMQRYQRNMLTLSPNQESGMNSQAVQRYQRNMPTLSPTISRADHESGMNNQAVQRYQRNMPTLSPTISRADHRADHESGMNNQDVQQIQRYQRNMPTLLPNQESGMNNQAIQQIQRYQRNMPTMSPTIPRADLQLQRVQSTSNNEHPTKVDASKWIQPLINQGPFQPINPHPSIMRWPNNNLPFGNQSFFNETGIAAIIYPNIICQPGNVWNPVSMNSAPSGNREKSAFAIPSRHEEGPINRLPYLASSIYNQADSTTGRSSPCSPIFNMQRQYIESLNSPNRPAIYKPEAHRPSSSLLSRTYPSFSHGSLNTGNMPEYDPRRNR